MADPPNDRFMTKVEFGRGKLEQRHTEEEDFTYEAPTFGGMVEHANPKKGAMLGTSHSSHHTHSSYDYEESTRSKLHKKSN